MKKLWYLLAILLCGTMLTFVVGCSDDDGASTGNNLTQGDPESDEFGFVEDNVGDAPFMSLGTSLDLSMMFLDSIPGAPASPERTRQRVSLSQEDDWEIVELSFDYAYVGDWHEFSFSAVVVDTIESDTADLMGTDSLQLLAGMSPVRYPDGTVNGIKIRNHYKLTVRGTEDSLTADHSIDIMGDILESSTFFTVNGSGTDALHALVSDSQATCELDVTYTHSINDLKAYFDTDDCPFDGSIGVTSTVDLSCASASGLDSLNVNGSWTITASYSDGMETITYQNGGIYWTVTQECSNTNPVDRASSPSIEVLADDHGGGIDVDSGD